jgi:hypothetical protein
MKHINMLCGQNAELILLNSVAHVAMAVLLRDCRTYKSTLMYGSCIVHTVITILKILSLKLV